MAQSRRCRCRRRRLLAGRRALLVTAKPVCSGHGQAGDHTTERDGDQHGPVAPGSGVEGRGGDWGGGSGEGEGEGEDAVDTGVGGHPIEIGDQGSPGQGDEATPRPNRATKATTPAGPGRPSRNTTARAWTAKMAAVAVASGQRRPSTVTRMRPPTDPAPSSPVQAAAKAAE